MGTPSFLTDHQKLVSGVGRGDGLLPGTQPVGPCLDLMAFVGHGSISLLSSLFSHSPCIQLHCVARYVCLHAHRETHTPYTNGSHSLLLESWKQYEFWNYLDLNVKF